MFLFLLVLLPIPAGAQTINPTVFDFDHEDFAQTDQYEVGYFSAVGAVAPVQTATLAKPATCAPCSGVLPSRPTAFGNWWVAVRANAGGASPVVSEWKEMVYDKERPAAHTNDGWDAYATLLGAVMAALARELILLA
jgi:hypothetical protein